MPPLCLDQGICCLGNQAEKKVKELHKRQYLDGDKSLEEKEKGNSFFKQGK